MAHHLAIIFAVYDQHLRFGNIVNRLAEENDQALVDCRHVWQHLVVARSRLRDEHGVAGHALVYLITCAASEEELPHDQPGGAGQHARGQSRLPEKGVMPTSKERVGER